MYYSELSGPNGTTSTVLQKSAGASPKKPAEGKAAGGEPAEKSGKAESPAYTISQSMESLLDNLSGKKAPAGGKADADAAKSGGMSGGGSMSGGGAGTKAMAERAKEGLQIMQSALEQSKGLAGMFGKAIDSLKSDLGSALGGLGMPEDKINDVLGGFGDHLKDKLKSMDFSKMTMDMSEARSAWSIESRGIELTIQDGDRSVRISFAKSTLDFRRDDQRLQATLNGDGSGSIGFEQSSMKVSGKATGMIVRAEGFSEDEIKGVLEKLNNMAAKGGGMNGLGVLKPTKSANGVMHLNLDLSVPVDGLTDKAEAKPAAKEEKPSAVNITA